MKTVRAEFIELTQVAPPNRVGEEGVPVMLDAIQVSCFYKSEIEAFKYTHEELAIMTSGTADMAALHKNKKPVKVGCTCIYLIAVMNPIYVEESYDEVRAKIMEAFKRVDQRLGSQPVST